VEDEPSLLASLRRRLTFEGFRVETAVTGLMALELFSACNPQLVILDVMLPELDGFAVASNLRAQSNVPILILTAKEAVEDRVRGLEAGADDYVVKPFAFEELLARVKALLRRARSSPLEGFEGMSFSYLSVDEGGREVRSGGQVVRLTRREFELICFFLRHPRQVLTREQIFLAVWGHDAEGASNVIDVHLRALRDKLELDKARLLHTVRGVGYVLREAE